MKSKKDIDIIDAEKAKEKSKNAWKYWNSKIERERELVFKPRAKENLVFFAVQKLYLKIHNLKDGLCNKKHNSS